MRPRKDPDIRRKEFISASRNLFTEKGFEPVSIRDVLDAVGEKSASPSVFYYYFNSKEELYKCVVESVAEEYVTGFTEIFSSGEKDFPTRLSRLLDRIRTYSMENRELLSTDSLVSNRLFVLDMKERVTKSIAEMWAKDFGAWRAGGGKRDDREMARFLAGGIGEFIFAGMTDQIEGREGQGLPMDRVTDYILTTLGYMQEEREKLIPLIQ